MKQCDYEQMRMRKILGEANEAKDQLARIAEKLEEIGKVRKARSCMRLVHQIEEWQNRN